jgi:hypothetical protein
MLPERADWNALLNWISLFFKIESKPPVLQSAKAWTKKELVLSSDISYFCVVISHKRSYLETDSVNHPLPYQSHHVRCDPVPEVNIQSC